MVTDQRVEQPARAVNRALPSARSITLAILAIGFLAALTANLPGQLSYDSIVQFADARTGRYHTWHPAVMAWLLGVGDAVLTGTAVYVTTVASLAYGSLALIVAHRARVTWAAPVVALLLAASPLLLLEQGIVWKDVLFADATLVGFVLLSLAARAQASRGGRIGLAVCSAALFVVAMLVRQNGIIAPVFAALAAGAVGWSRRSDLPLRGRATRAAAAGGGFLAAILVCALLINAALMTRRAADDVGAGGQIRVLKIYDLVGVLKRVPDLDLSAVHASGLDVHLRAALPLYTPLQNDSITGEEGIDDAITRGSPGLDAAWRSAILHHPGAYLAHRFAVFQWIAFPPDVTRCTAVYSGVDGPPELMQQLNLKSAWRAQDIKLAHYAQAFVHTPLYSHLFWGLVAAAAAALLLAARRPEDTVLSVGLLAALAYGLSYALIGIACDHRYLYVVDLSAMAGLLRLACDPPAWLRGRLGRRGDDAVG